jgi:4-amino-4-deoxy-L-arabinose transferase-like glycosyltransferase
MVFSLGRSCRDAETGGIAACVFSSTALGFYFGGTVMTDPALLFGVTLAMFGFWNALAQPEETHRIYGYLFFIGLAVGALAKGPIGIVLPGISIAAFIAFQRNWSQTWRRLPWFTGTALALLLVVPWYVLAEMRSPGFLHYFIVGEHFERFITPHWEGSLYEPGRPHAKGTIVLYFLIAALPWTVVFATTMLRGARRSEWPTRETLSTPWVSFLVCWLLGSIALFFFASNILLSYAATSIPAFALLAAQSMPLSRHRRGALGMVVVSMMVPVLFLGGVIAGRIEPHSPLLRSQQGIVAAFNSAAGNARAELYYVVNKPYSADFYTHGRAKRLEHVDDIAGLMNDPANFFAIAEDLYQHLPESVRRKLAIRADRNGYLLLSLDRHN